MARSQTLTGVSVPLGELRIGPLISSGGFGVVHEASISGVNLPFAVKFLDPLPFNEAAAARERFFLEAELLFKLRHRYIVPIYGVGEHNGRPYILMEKFNGYDLQAARDRHGPPQPETILPFFEFVVDALGYAHSKDVVHRDVKPRNLMTIQGDARVLDFGIATVLDPDGQRLTRTGGTWVGDAFSAPELIENPTLRDGRCDIYSVGACWFWLLTGKAPKGRNWEAALRSSIKVTPEYEKVLLRCLDQPEARYGTMQELLEEIRALRMGNSPKAAEDLLTDDDALILGIVAAACASPDQTTTFYQIEQQLQGTMTRLAISVANRRLLRLGLIVTSLNTAGYGDPVPEVQPSTKGEMWIEMHQRRVSLLLEKFVPTRPMEQEISAPTDGDIPF